MTKQWLSVQALCICIAVLAADSRAAAQEGQAKYITEATLRLTKLVTAGNKEGYSLQDNSFSIGGGWLKQSESDWIALYTVQLTAGKKYRFIAAGDADAKDVDLDVQDSTGKTVAADVDTAAEAVVNYSPKTSGRYTVRLRLFASDNNLPCVCLGIVMVKK